MGTYGSEQLYAALLAFRAAKSAIEGVMPETILSNAQVQDILRYTPASLSLLSSIPSLSALARLDIREGVVSLVNQLAQTAPSAGPRPLEHHPPKSLVSTAFGPRKRAIGSKLALEKDDAAAVSASVPQPASVSTSVPDPIAPLDLKSTRIYEKYQKEMKSVEFIASLEETVEEIQRQLLDVFAAGYPVQLSRLDIPSAKIVYTAIPTILSLRQAQGGAGGSLKLDMEDIANPSLTQAVKTLYPSVTELQIKLALCEWYHDLHPELQLNSAKYVLPKTRSKRKDISEASLATHSRNPPTTATPSSGATPALSSAPKSAWTARSIGFPTQIPRTRTSRAKILVSGAHDLDRDCDEEAEVDQDPSPDYQEGKDSDNWRDGTRPKKLPKRTSTPFKFVSFTDNAAKDRAALTDDDFSGTEEAYFAGVYSPPPKTQSPIVSSSGKPISDIQPSNTTMKTTSRLFPASFQQKNGTLSSNTNANTDGNGNGKLSSSALLAVSSVLDSAETIEPAASKGKVGHFVGLNPQATLDLFDSVRRASCRPIVLQSQ